MKTISRVLFMIGAFTLLLSAAGCGKEEVLEEDEKTSPRARTVTTEGMTAENASPEVLVAAYRASAESLGLRDESDPDAGVFLYLDETTTLLYRLSVHGIDPAFLPEVGPILKDTNKDGYLVIESTIHADALIWIEAVSVLSEREANKEAPTEERIRQIQDAFAKHLREERAR